MRKSLWLLPALLLLAGCRDDVVGPPAGSLGGFVYEADGTPALGAKLTVVYDVPAGVTRFSMAEDELQDLVTVLDSEPSDAAFLLRATSPWPTSSGRFIFYRYPEAGVMTLSLFDARGERIIHVEETTAGPGTGAFSRNGMSEAFPNGYYLLRLSFAGETVRRTEVVYGLLLNEGEDLDFRPLTSTNEAGRWDLPLADLALGTLVCITRAPEDGGVTHRRVPARVRILATDGERAVSRWLELPDPDRDYEIELTFPPSS